MSSTSSSGRILQAGPSDPASSSASRDRPDPATSREDELVDEASEASMDASDPPSFGGATGVGAPVPEPIDEDPSGLAGAGGRVGDDDDGRQRMVERRAYELWNEAGRPEDSDQEFWFQAERELDMPGDPTSPAG